LLSENWRRLFQLRGAMAAAAAAAAAALLPLAALPPVLWTAPAMADEAK
jgi:hypothetical protein